MEAIIIFLTIQFRATIWLMIIYCVLMKAISRTTPIVLNVKWNLKNNYIFFCVSMKFWFEEPSNCYLKCYVVSPIFP